MKVVQICKVHYSWPEQCTAVSYRDRPLGAALVLLFWSTYPVAANCDPELLCVAERSLYLFAIWRKAILGTFFPNLRGIKEGQKKTPFLALLNINRLLTSRWDLGLLQITIYMHRKREKGKFEYLKYFIVSPASIVNPLESKPARIIQLN